MTRHHGRHRERSVVLVIARSASDAAIHAAGIHGLLDCVRNDDALSRQKHPFVSVFLSPNPRSYP